MAHFVLHAHILRSSLALTDSGTNRLWDYFKVLNPTVALDDGGTKHTTNTEAKH